MLAPLRTRRRGAPFWLPGDAWPSLTVLFRGLTLFKVAQSRSGARLGRESAKLRFCDSHCSRCLLLLAGDVERNPGPISIGKNIWFRHTYRLLSSFTDAKPQLYHLHCMPYTNKDGVSVYFRLMDRIKPRLTRVAIALGFPRHIIDVIEKENEPAYYLLSEWLKDTTESMTLDH